MDPSCPFLSHPQEEEPQAAPFGSNLKQQHPKTIQTPSGPLTPRFLPLSGFVWLSSVSKLTFTLHHSQPGFLVLHSLTVEFNSYILLGVSQSHKALFSSYSIRFFNILRVNLCLLDSTILIQPTGVGFISHLKLSQPLLSVQLPQNHWSCNLSLIHI